MKMQNNLGGTCKCGGAPKGGTGSDAHSRRSAIHIGTDSGQSPYFGREFDIRQILAPASLFSFGPCTARFLFSPQEEKRENGGCIAQPSPWLNASPPARAKARPRPGGNPGGINRDIFHKNRRAAPSQRYAEPGRSTRAHSLLQNAGCVQSY